ncbi:g-protein coupled receptor protein [Ophiostoma piceae UAMH 11346]|uniref:G-protein coupled receptor protein n=1 Tax=Ophiostoma piceae (strain UAMH 11346) TaxID=1262450 RepID=S3D5Q1_OPHP1|nr:g-protein coupled receptor protein [Ophiostoma piceae UAMH 11346]
MLVAIPSRPLNDPRPTDERPAEEHSTSTPDTQSHLTSRPAPNMSTAYSAPVGGTGGTPGAYPMFFTPVAITVARGFQIFVSLLIMIMGGLLMHGLVMGPYSFAFVCGLFTLIISLYAVLTEKVKSCRAGYNYWAVLSLDLVMIIFWLSSMGAVAHLRGTFKYDTHAECYNNGDTFNSNYCVTSKRSLAKRAAVAGKVALAEMSAIAGLSALQTLLFVATFAYLAHQLRLHHKAVKGGVASNDAGVVEMKGHLQPAPAAPSPAPVYDSTAYSAPPPGSGPGPAPYSTQAYYQPQPAQSYGFAQPSTVPVVPGQTPYYDPYAYQPQVTPSQTPAPGPDPNSLPHTYSAAPAVRTPEPYHSTSAY